MIVIFWRQLHKSLSHTRAAEGNIKAGETELIPSSDFINKQGVSKLLFYTVSNHKKLFKCLCIEISFGAGAAWFSFAFVENPAQIIMMMMMMTTIITVFICLEQSITPSPVDQFTPFWTCVLRTKQC